MVQMVIQKIRSSSWVAFILAFIGWVVYFIQALGYTHILTSFVDEGGYLYIGELFTKGIIRPFQDYGVMRLYSPLAYLIPGQIEAWFGASLLTGRNFSVSCGLLMVMALWITARRLGGKWLGAAVVWGVALTPISIQIYSLAISQALVACLLAWSLMLVLGEGRPIWQITGGSFLAGIMVMTRQNLFPVIPLLVAYVFWQHGKKAGLWALVGSLLPISVIHILYWPNILQIWAVWLPPSLTPFLDFVRPPAATSLLETGIGFSSRLLSFLQGIRFHYFTTIGFITVLFLWPRRNEWVNQSNRRSAWFLAILFTVLASLHAWESFLLLDPYCTFCFTPYLAFFDFIIFLLIAVSISSWRKKISRIKQSGIILVVILLSAGLGYAVFDRFGPWLLKIEFPAFTRGLNPRTWTPFITLWDILANKFHLDYWTSRLYVPVFSGLIIGLIFLILQGIEYRILIKRTQMSRYSFGTICLLAFLATGIWLSPLMGGTYRQDGICRVNIPQTYKQIGSSLSSIIPPGTRVYWDSITAVALLYTPEIAIYYPQIYASFSFRLNGDPQQLARYGLWNDALAGQWWKKASYMVIENDFGGAYHPANFDPSQFNIFQTGPMNPCNPSSYLRIYQRKP